MSNLIIGYGEIGKAIHAVVGESGVVDLNRQEDIPKSVDVMHVCFPYHPGFVADVLEYMERYKPAHVIVYSTLPIGTTKMIKGLVHSPVEGKHPDLELSIRQMERWIGYNDKAEAQFFANFFNDLGIKSKLVGNSDFTEALKLLSTTEYGLNIEFARYKKHVADSLEMDYELTKQWNEEYNRLYRNLGMDKRFQKFVLDPPDGPKGGHCIVPNAQLLNDQYPSELVKLVGEL